MRSGQASRTAYRVAWRRAQHQRIDARPLVLDDPLAGRILGPELTARFEAADRKRGEERRGGRVMRAFVVARSRFAEDALAAAVARGVRQYLVLGAGLDTSAYRHPHAAAGLRVFEADHPDTQAAKRHHLRAAGIAEPPELTFVSVDFETQSLPERLIAAGFEAGAPVFVSWLGVTMYLTTEAWRGTSTWLATRAPGSEVVFDYSVSPSLLSWRGKFIHWLIRRRVARVGEPWRTHFRPDELQRELRSAGFSAVEDLGADELNTRYFRDRTDDLRVRGYGRLAGATV